MDAPTFEVRATRGFHSSWPGAVVGLMAISDIQNPDRHPQLDDAKMRLEDELRRRYSGRTRADVRADPTFAAYERYYRRFGNTYHVQLQLESVALKGKPIASVSALVEAMFMSELDTGLLTAVHDLGAVKPPLLVDVANEGMTYIAASGREATLKPDDIYMADAEGIICSILYGQDARTRVSAATTAALFVVYTPPGITVEQVRTHFKLLSELVTMFAPDAVPGEVVLVPVAGQ